MGEFTALAFLLGIGYVFAKYVLPNLFQILTIVAIACLTISFSIAIANYITAVVVVIGKNIAHK